MSKRLNKGKQKGETKGKERGAVVHVPKRGAGARRGQKTKRERQGATTHPNNTGRGGRAEENERNKATSTRQVADEKLNDKTRPRMANRTQKNKSTVHCENATRDEQEMKNVRPLRRARGGPKLDLPGVK
jgi:hypothetical protein